MARRAATTPYFSQDTATRCGRTTFASRLQLSNRALVPGVDLAAGSLVASGDPTLVVLRPAGDRLHLHAGRMVLATGLDGFIRRGEQGLFVHETRMVSEYRYRLDATEPRPAGISLVSARESQGYYLIYPPGRGRPEPDRGSGMLIDDTQQTVELHVTRVIGDELAETLAITNYSDAATRFELGIAIDADFFGLPEIRNGSEHLGHVNRSWDGAAGTLSFDWRAKRKDRDVEDHRQILIIVNGDSAPALTDSGLAFPVSLEPGARWNGSVRMIPFVQGRTRPAAPAPDAADGEARLAGSRPIEIAAVVTEVLDRARADVRDLRLGDLDTAPDAWTVAAGVPLYVALFGRDTLVTAWQAAMLTPDIMRGSLSALAKLQGQEWNDWRDEAPGRLLHEAHTGPLETLDVNPRLRYYGSVTTSGFFPVVLASYWHWTADEEFVRAMLPHALEALRWLDEEGDLDGDGFVEYRTRSRDGVKHQGWKDSEDAIVYPDGRVAEPPIATCEEQAFVYAAKFLLAEVMWRLGERAQARRLFREARRLKRKFNEVFWLPDAGFYAMALDARKQPIGSIASNAGHCLAAGLVPRDRIRPVADRLLADDLFSGWGIRTLSSGHPAFNPYSYHRGSVWPVEQGSFALGFMRFGLYDHLHRLARAVFDAASMFEHRRLPELFAGHQRDGAHAFPGLYPQANAPQAWSASTLILMAQALLGLYPYAPSKLLIVNPQLPPWLPEFTVENLRVGEAVVTLRFQRSARGRTTYRVLSKQGTLHIVRQASPWSLTESAAHRVRDALASALAR